MSRLAQSPAPAAAAPTQRAERIADPEKFDGSREKLNVFKDQLILKTSGNEARFPDTQHKLRYAYQFLTGKAQRTMRIHLRRTEVDGNERYDVVFNTFAAFLAALDRHFGDPDEQHTASLQLDKLRQANREFGAYYADFMELMDVLDNMDDTSRRHALKRGLNLEMRNALAIYPAPKYEGFDAYVERLNELDCWLRALRTDNARSGQPNQQPNRPTANPGPSTATGTTAGPMDLSASRKKLTNAEKARRRAQGLCLYCGGAGHFAAACPTTRSGSGSGSGRRGVAGAAAVLQELDSDSEESGKEEARD